VFHGVRVFTCLFESLPPTAELFCCLAARNDHQRNHHALCPAQHSEQPPPAQTTAASESPPRTHELSHTRNCQTHLYESVCVCVVVDIYSYMISRYHIRNQNMTYGMSVYMCIYNLYHRLLLHQSIHHYIVYVCVCVCMWARWYTHIYIAPTQYCYIKCWYKDAHGLSKISLPDVNLLCCCNRRQHSEAPSLVEVMNCIQRSPRSEYFGSWPVLTVPRDGARAVCTTQCKATPRTGLPSMQCLCRVNCQPSKTQQRQSFDICSPFPQGKPWIKNWARTVSEWILCVYCVSMSISLCVCMYVIIRNYMYIIICNYM
jgi:hypothetical protein